MKTYKDLMEEMHYTTKSSWLRKAEYYYNRGAGYLILNMGGKNYTFKGVPRELWKKFKVAESYGKFYHKYIRGRYYFYRATLPAV